MANKDLENDIMQKKEIDNLIIQSPREISLKQELHLNIRNKYILY